MVLVEKKNQVCPKCHGILTRNLSGDYRCISCHRIFEDIPFIKKDGYRSQW